MNRPADGLAVLTFSPCFRDGIPEPHPWSRRQLLLRRGLPSYVPCASYSSAPSTWARWERNA
ncbi:hypothetical protein GCM10010324_07590 [Streptomyces hiroshimensis]|uniref:Uncharacterized protein n=1 Tax=Streptomyces hiroshimensis TaxID=66424 RepID=A0ABQ2Y5Q0_9ACTN|nr:hypothetical protein GCM10010324_07590 [Streptomyces hiroshimensis]